jgi:hypothetical protein
MKRAKTFIAIGAAGFATIAIAGDMARYEPVGKPVSCINTMNIQSTKILDDRTIEFKMSGRKIYHNVMDYKCSGLKSEDRFSYRVTSNSLCSVDIIHVLHDYGGQLQNGAGCGLGKFQQVQKVK